MKQEGVAKLVGEVAGVAPRRVGVIVDDCPARSVEHRNGRERFDFNLTEVADRRRGAARVARGGQNGS